MVQEGGAEVNEAEQALAIAERVLDRPHADPDDDMAILARQTKRAAELRKENAELRERVTVYGNMVDWLCKQQRSIAEIDARLKELGI